ncbi:MAG: YggS family pyridoxal phosphate-dependent enzyme [Flavobacteriia bacterium]|nr:YggS family pyridoxal phosphate-dependent enzyme [Flavobacteriia bacterium]
MEAIVQNLQIIEQRIQSACDRSNRKRDEVRLLLATKTVNPERIRKAFEAGYTLIAENKIQELKEKYEDLKDSPHTSHFIGHLQTNKVKEILRYDVNCIESVDRLKLAQKLQNRLVYEDKTMDVLIQINTSFEESKFGISPENALDLVKEVAKLDRIRIKGLMTIGLFSAETEKVRRCFKLLKEIQNQIIEENIPNVEMKELSMGMSGDLEVAIEEGSTIVRVGTAVFGKRPYPDSYYWNERN